MQGPDRSSVRGTVMAAISNIIGCDVGHDEPLLVSGLDSLAAVELHNDLSRYIYIGVLGTMPRCIILLGQLSSVFVATARIFLFP